MQSPKMHLNGVLSRCIFDGDRAEVRVTPFIITQDPFPVWALVFEKPKFDATTVQPYLNAEVEIEIFERRATVFCFWPQAELDLGGTSLKVTQTSYDTADLLLHVRNLEGRIDDLDGRLRAAKTKDKEGRAILRELHRRAEIKSAASDHLRERQAAAVEVLKRLRTHFGD